MRDLPLGLMFCFFCSPHVGPNEVISLACSGSLALCRAAVREPLNGEVVPAITFGFHYITYFYWLLFLNSPREAKFFIMMVFYIL